MIRPFNSVKFSRLMVIALLLHLLTHLKFILMMKDFCWCQLQKLFSKLFYENGSSYQNQLRQVDLAESDDDEDDRPSPHLVPVPYLSHVVSSSIKTRLPVVEFNGSKFHGAGDGEQSAVRAICLACIEGSEEIREPANCSHVYHRECADGWIDQGCGTCPLCRLKLLPADADDYRTKKVKKIHGGWKELPYLLG